MQDKSKALQAALRANSVCSCITLDRDMLQATLNSQTGREGFGGNRGLQAALLGAGLQG